MGDQQFSQGTITFNADNVKEFRKQLQAAEDSGAETFTFDGKEFLVAYAHYLNSYLLSRGL